MSKTMDPMYEAQGELLREVATLKATLALKEEALAGSEAARLTLVEALKAQGIENAGVGTTGRAPGWCIGRCPVRAHSEECEQARAALAANTQPSAALAERIERERADEREAMRRDNGLIKRLVDESRAQVWDAAVEACAARVNGAGAMNNHAIAEGLRSLLGKVPQ